MRGPIDYIIVGFTINNFTGEILKELETAVKNNTIAVLALAIISRDNEGNVATLKVTDEEAMKFIADFNLDEKLISEEDIAEVGELLEDNTSAGLLIIEHLWAKGLKQAIHNANGVLLDEGRIHPDASKDLDEKGVA